jgi:hypothetical protein
VDPACVQHFYLPSGNTESLITPDSCYKVAVQ